jgi:hypothetical protein
MLNDDRVIITEDERDAAKVMLATATSVDSDAQI